MAEFADLGAHCMVADCRQRDFLPFTCDCCSKPFCLPHRSYAAHSCPSSGVKDFRAVVCPICLKTIRFTDDQDVNTRWDLHSRTECQPDDYAKNTKGKKRRCPAPGCRENLGPTNTNKCARCGASVCLKHRYPDSHACHAAGSWSGSRPPQSMGAYAAAMAAAGRPQQPQQAARPTSMREKQKAGAKAARTDPTNTVQGTAARRRQQGASGTSGGGGGAPTEQCPQCGAGFADVGQLVAHVESFHGGGQASP